MKRKKKVKIKVGNLIITILVFIGLIVLITNLLGLFKKDFKVEIKNLTLEVGEEFKMNLKQLIKE